MNKYYLEKCFKNRDKISHIQPHSKSTNICYMKKSTKRDFTPIHFTQSATALLCILLSSSFQLHNG